MNVKLKSVPLALGSLLCISSVGAATEPELLAKNETESVPSIVLKPAGTPPALEVFVNKDAAPVPAGTSIIKLALHEPVIQLPEMTIG